MFKRILVPTDGSDLAKTAAKTAIDLAVDINATVVAVHIIDQQLIQPFDILQEEGNSYLEQIESYAKTKSVTCIKELIYGSPKNDIKTIVRKCDADLIIMGTKGATGIKSTLMGSLAQHTLKTVDLPIMLIK